MPLNLGPKSTRDDFVDKAVPADARDNWLSVFAVWVGFIVVIGIMAVGGGLASQMQLRDLIPAVVGGNVLLAAFAFFSGWIGAASGMTFNQLAAISFPGFSWRLVTAYVPIVLIGWFGVEAAIFGNLIGEILDLPTLGRRSLMSGATLAFAVSSYWGFVAMRWVSMVAVPCVILLGGYALLSMTGGNEARFGFGADTLDLSTAVSLVSGTWIMGVLTCLPDLTRFCRTPLTGAVVGSAGILFGNSFTLFVGASGAALANEYDPAKILVSFGLIPLAVLLALANIWTTNDNNMYSAALNAARIFSVSRQRAVIGCAILAAAFAALDPTRISFLFSFLTFMGSTSPALGGVVLGSWVMRRAAGWKCARAWPAWLGWIVGSVCGVGLGGIWTVPVGFASGWIAWMGLARLPSARFLKN